MSKLSKVLSVLLAMVLLFTSASIGVEAAYNAYKDTAITGYDSIDRPILTTDQYASMAMDEVDRMLGEANLKINYDLAGILELNVDLSSINKALDSIKDTLGMVRGSTLDMIGGDIKNLNFSALVDMNANPVTLTCPKRDTAGKSDKDIFLALLKFLKDNSAIIAKVPKGSTANGGVDLGPIVSNFVDLGDMLNVPKLVKELVGKFFYPDTPKAELPLNKTLDEMVKDFIDVFASGEYANYTDGVGFLKDASKLVVKYLPGITDKIDFLEDSVYDIIDKGVKIMLNAVAIPYLNPRIKAALNRLCGYDYYKTKDEDGDTVWKPVEVNPQNDLNAMINVINTDFNLDPLPVESWGNDWIFDHLNDIVGAFVREAIKPEIAINWETANGNADLRDNVIAVAKTILSNTGDALFANYIEVLSADEIENMDDEPFMAYVLRSILNASISSVYITHDGDENETVLEVLFELVKQLAADFVPWRDYSDLDADLDGIMAIGLDMAVYGLNGITNMNLEYGLDKYEFADQAMAWVIDNYGGFVNDVQGTDGWEKLSYVLFNVIPSNWLSLDEFGSERTNIYDILVYDIVENALDLNFDGVLTLLDKNPTGELNYPIISLIMARLTGIVNYILPGVFPDTADYSELENLLDPELLSQIIENLLSSLYDRANGTLLNAALPVVCMALGLSSPETFGYPYISLEDEHTMASNVLTSFYMYNGSSGINTNATDKYGNTPTVPDKLYTYRVKSVTTNNSSVRVTTPAGAAVSNLTINGGTSQTFNINGVEDAVGSVLKITITYDVLSEKGTVMTPNPLTATTYTYVYAPGDEADDKEVSKDAVQTNMHLIKYEPNTYLSKGSTLGDLADYSIDLRRNKYSDATLHQNNATISLSNSNLDPNLAALGVSVQPVSVSTVWQGNSTDYEPYVVGDPKEELPEGTYTTDFFFTATPTESVAENISCTHNVFVYDDWNLGSLLRSAVNADRQKANYSGTHEYEYVDFYEDPKAEDPEMATGSINANTAWNNYVAAVDAAAEIVYAPRHMAAVQDFVDNGAYEEAAHNLYDATKQLDACSASGGTDGIKSALYAIVAPDTFINEFGEEETYDYDSPNRTYFGRADYVNYTYSNFKKEMRSAEREIDAEKEAQRKGTDYQIEAIRAAYIAHRVNLYGERLVRIQANTRYLEEAINKYADYLNAPAGTYSTKTWNAFTRAYAFATAVVDEDLGSTVNSGPGADVNLEGDGLRQTKVNEARAQLVKAAKRLAPAVETVDYTQLQQLVDTVEPTFTAGNSEPTYTELSWNTFVSAYRDALDIIDDELELSEANQRKVNNAYDALNAAYNGLETIQSGGGEWSFTDGTTFKINPSPFNAMEYVTGLDPDWPYVSDGVEYSGTITVEVETNEFDAESTGAILKVYDDGALVEEYPIVLFADITGDGYFDIADMGELIDGQSGAGLTTWEDFFDTDENAYAWSADLDHSGYLDLTDVGIMADFQGWTIEYYQTWVEGEDPYDTI